jgi:hypothetical protein
VIRSRADADLEKTLTASSFELRKAGNEGLARVSDPLEFFELLRPLDENDVRRTAWSGVPIRPNCALLDLHADSPFVIA